VEGFDVKDKIGLILGHGHGGGGAPAAEKRRP
jgi:hypothetical protein